MKNQSEMKHWKIDYCAKYKDGPERRFSATISAPTIRTALDKAETKIVTPMRLNMQGGRVVIRKIEMTDEDIY